jgi:hypothetical protein
MNHALYSVAAKTDFIQKPLRKRTAQDLVKDLTPIDFFFRENGRTVSRIALTDIDIIERVC